MTITEVRAQFVEAAIHSGEIEGLTVSDATLAELKTIHFRLFQDVYEWALAVLPNVRSMVATNRTSSASGSVGRDDCRGLVGLHRGAIRVYL